MTESLSILKELSQIPGLMKEIYGDLAKPGVSQVGKALGNILGLGNTILWPVALLNERTKIKLERNLEKYREQLKDIPDNEISEVPPEIGVPVAEKLSYVTNEELSNLYINLLAKASTFKTSKKAHPSFVNIINNLSPDEAILLDQFKKGLPVPFVEARLVNKKTSRYAIVHDMLPVLSTDKLTFPENMSSYISNFEGLGLIKIYKDVCLEEKLYIPLEKEYMPIFDSIDFDKETRKPQFHRGEIMITSFGMLFISGCLTSLDECGQ